MNTEEIYNQIKRSPIGAYFNLSWDRGNGEIARPVVYLGYNEDNEPILIDSSYISKPSKKPVFLDINQLENILSIEKITSTNPVSQKDISKILESVQ